MWPGRRNFVHGTVYLSEKILQAYIGGLRFTCNRIYNIRGHIARAKQKLDTSFQDHLLCTKRNLLLLAKPYSHSAFADLRVEYRAPKVGISSTENWKRMVTKTNLQNISSPLLLRSLRTWSFFLLQRSSERSVKKIYRDYHPKNNSSAY